MLIKSAQQLALLSILVACCFACGAGSSGSNATLVTPEGVTVEVTQPEVTEMQMVADIKLPEGFERVPADARSFATYLRQVPFKKGENVVYLYDGSRKGNQNAHFAILDVDVGKKDLQQCADAVMRLRAEYLYGQKRYKDIHFNFTSGDEVGFDKYAQGYRVRINGNKVSWSKQAQQDYGYKTFRQYMDLIFSYAGTTSLSKELKPVSKVQDIQPGDVFIRGGFPGHAVIVMDVAQHKSSGQKLFLLAQSYMPAQEIHILKNPMNDDLSPWYASEFEGSLDTPEWIFEQGELMRF